MRWKPLGSLDEDRDVVSDIRRARVRSDALALVQVLTDNEGSIEKRRERC